VLDSPRTTTRCPFKGVVHPVADKLAPIPILWELFDTIYAAFNAANVIQDKEPV